MGKSNDTGNEIIFLILIPGSVWKQLGSGFRFLSGSGFRYNGYGSLTTLRLLPGRVRIRRCPASPG